PGYPRSGDTAEIQLHGHNCAAASRALRLVCLWRYVYRNGRLRLSDPPDYSRYAAATALRKCLHSRRTVEEVFGGAGRSDGSIARLPVAPALFHASALAPADPPGFLKHPHGR